MSVTTKKSSVLHQLKMTVLMFAAAVLTVAPMMELAISGEVNADPGGCSANYDYVNGRCVKRKSSSPPKGLAPSPKPKPQPSSNPITNIVNWFTGGKKTAKKSDNKKAEKQRIKQAKKKAKAAGYASGKCTMQRGAYAAQRYNACKSGRKQKQIEEKTRKNAEKVAPKASNKAAGSYCSKYKNSERRAACAAGFADGFKDGFADLPGYYPSGVCKPSTWLTGKLIDKCFEDWKKGQAAGKRASPIKVKAIVAPSKKQTCKYSGAKLPNGQDACRYGYDKAAKGKDANCNSFNGSEKSQQQAKWACTMGSIAGDKKLKEKNSKKKSNKTKKSKKSKNNKKSNNGSAASGGGGGVSGGGSGDNSGSGDGNTPKPVTKGLLTIAPNKQIVKSGEKFRVKVTVKNPSTKAIKATVSWMPKNLTLSQPKKANNKKVAITKKKLTAKNIGVAKKRPLSFVVVAQFDKDAKNGTKEKTPITLKYGDKTTKQTISTRVGNKDKQAKNSLAITARVFNAQFNKDGILTPPAAAHYDYLKDKKKTADKRVFPYGPKNKRHVKQNEWFTIQFRVANRTGKAVKNATIKWNAGKDNLELKNGKGVYVKNLKNLKPKNKKNKAAGITTYIAIVKFTDKAQDGDTIKVMPSISSKVKGVKGDKVNSINVQVGEPKAPFAVTKEVSKKSPMLGEPYTYTIKVANNSQKAQKVKFSDTNTHPLVQSFDAFTIEGATNSTLKIADFDKAATAVELPVEVDATSLEGKTAKELWQIYQKRQKALNNAKRNLANAKSKGTVQTKNKHVVAVEKRIANLEKRIKKAKGDQKKKLEKQLKKAKQDLSKAKKAQEKQNNKKPAKGSTIKQLRAKKKQAQMSFDKVKKAFDEKVKGLPNVDELKANFNAARENYNKAQKALVTTQASVKKLNAELKNGQAVLKARAKARENLQKSQKSVTVYQKNLRQAKTQAAKKRAQTNLERAQKNVAYFKKVGTKQEDDIQIIARAKKPYQLKLAKAQKILPAQKQAEQVTRAKLAETRTALVKVLGEIPPENDPSKDVGQECAEDQKDEDGLCPDGSENKMMEQRLEGTFDLAAGATATIKLTATIIADTPEANAIKNSAAISVKGLGEVKSNETVVSLCRKEGGCDPAPKPNQPKPNQSRPAQNNSGGGGGGESLPSKLASTGPGAVIASVVGISALGYGARQWMASRRAMHDAMEGLYRKK